MKEWKEYRFEELYLEPSKNGLSKPSSIRGAGYKMINMGELFSNDFIRDIDMELVPLTDKEKKSAKIEVNDLLFARQSLTLEGAGKCSIVIETSPLTVFESHLIRVRLNQKLANPVFFYYYFKSTTSPIKNIVTQAVQAGIKASELATIKLKVPPLSEQKKIAGILSSLDAKIETNRKINARLEELARAIFKSWFIDYAPFGGQMPPDWKAGVLSDIANIIMGQSPKGDFINKNEDGMIFYQGKTEFGERFPSVKNYTTGVTRVAPAYSVLLSVRAPVGDVNITLNECCIGRGIASIAYKYGPNSFLYLLLKSKRDYFDIFDKGGTVFGCINKNNLEQMPIILPPLSIIESFNLILHPLDEEIERRSKESARLAELRDTLLPKLMSGELMPE